MTHSTQTEAHQTIHGSHGCLSVDPRGRVMDYQPGGDGDYRNIIRVDLARYRRETGDMGREDIDILRVGYWHREAGELSYEEPVDEVLTGAAWGASADDIAASPVLTQASALYAPILLVAR